MAGLHAALGQNGHGVGVEGGQMVGGGKDGQLRTGQHAAVTALCLQVTVDGGELLGIAVTAGFDVVVNEGHDQFLRIGGGHHRLNAEGGEFLLVQAGLNGAVGGQNAGAAQTLFGQRFGGLPDHVENGDGQMFHIQLGMLLRFAATLQEVHLQTVCSTSVMAVTTTSNTPHLS